MGEVEVAYRGALSLEARHRESGATLPLEIASEDGGRGGAFSPTELVGAALASCMLSAMGQLAERHAWPLEGARAVVSKQMRTQRPRRIERLEVVLHLPAALPPEARGPLERATRACPVHRSLHPDIEQHVEFRW